MVLRAFFFFLNFLCTVHQRCKESNKLSVVQMNGGRAACVYVANSIHQSSCRFQMIDVV